MTALEQSLSGLRQSMSPEGSPDFCLVPAPVSTADLAQDRDRVLAILNRWQISASSRGKKQAMADCDLIIKFIRTVCP